ncbi:right-handed parallel beta-helix repeat-containing protein [Candidatus Amarolinea dominans]|uniref:right-handed parallel beta-helix repeat-containing protein n=1 Tax=Candidatus Amarolinea dominans TaxID=3140696 RepID=UPI00313516C0|nr:right-handed parallel beta-helix repeat-containing protein [Anaerolineae bacterium]
MRGLVVNGWWDDYGIVIDGTGNRVECSFLGTNAAGTAATPNSVGVGIVGGGSNNIGGNLAGTRNLISGNTGDGVYLTNGVSNNAVYGNYIGTDVNGSLDLGNGNSGVAFSNASSNTVGLPNPSSRNVIAGNNNTGIVFSNGSNNNSVVANYIGLNASGTAAVPNNVAGVFINNGAGNIIGDSSAPARNIISGNENQGVLIFGPSSGNFVRGNTIGLDPAGAVAIPNQGSGVRLASGATLNVIGGSVDAARNIISGNDNEGVLIRGRHEQQHGRAQLHRRRRRWGHSAAQRIPGRRPGHRSRQPGPRQRHLRQPGRRRCNLCGRCGQQRRAGQQDRRRRRWRDRSGQRYLPHRGRRRSGCRHLPGRWQPDRRPGGRRCQHRRLQRRQRPAGPGGCRQPHTATRSTATAPWALTWTTMASPPTTRWTRTPAAICCRTSRR